jgi:hypothetical protein
MDVDEIWTQAIKSHIGTWHQFRLAFGLFPSTNHGRLELEALSLLDFALLKLGFRLCVFQGSPQFRLSVGWVGFSFIMRVVYC